MLVLAKIILFFVFSGVVGLGAKRFFCWFMGLDHGRDRRRYPVLAFVLCLVMAYCAEEFFGVADITGAYAVSYTHLDVYKRQHLIMIGVGNLGRALLQNFRFSQTGFTVDAAFDVAPLSLIHIFYD